VPQEKAATFDADLQGLIGWKLGPSHVGHIYTRPDHFGGPMAERIAIRRDFED
jgi:hypothetical protein